MRQYICILSMLCTVIVICKKAPQSFRDFQTEDFLARISRTVDSYQGPAPVLFKIAISDSIYELGESFYLSVELSNLLDVDLPVDHSYLFDAYDHTKIFLQTPRDEIWVLKTGHATTVGFTGYSLAPGETVSDGMYLELRQFLPGYYRKRIEKLPSGKYNLFAVYRTAVDAFGWAAVYSDTIEFEYKPYNRKYRRVLKELDSLWGGSDRYTITLIDGYSKIRDSRTPYSKAGWFHYLWKNKGNLSYDSFMILKSLHDSLYPASPYQHLLLEWQYRLRNGVQSESDSLLIEWKITSPRNIRLLRIIDSERALDPKR